MNLIYALRTLKCDLKNKLCKQKFTPEMVIIFKVTKMYNAIYIHKVYGINVQHVST